MRTPARRPQAQVLGLGSSFARTASVISTVLAAPAAMAFWPPAETHHVVGANLAFLHHGRDCVPDAARLLDLADVLQHHHRREEHRDGIHDRRIKFGIFRRRSVGGLEDCNFVPDICRTRQSPNRRSIPRTHRKSCRRTSSKPPRRRSLRDSWSATSSGRRCSWTTARFPGTPWRRPWPRPPSFPTSRAARLVSRRW